MDHIFGDTDDITFGSSSHSAPKPRPHDIKQTPIRERSGTTQNPKPLPKRETPPRPSRPTEMVSPIIPELDPLTRLVNSMKASFLPKEDDMNTVRMVILSEATHTDPLILTTRDDETILIGSGFSSITRAGKLYSTFPDMRLVFSEKEHLSAWVLTDETIDIHPILSILPSLGFPPIYAPR